MTDRHLVRIRWGVRGALALGVAASVAANMLHADPNPIAQTISAWPPLALLLTVELISRVPAHRRSLATVRFTATALIAGIAAWVSYTHMVAVAARYGEEGLAPHLIPLSVDGVVVVASVCLVELAGRMRRNPDPADLDRPAPADTAADTSADDKREPRRRKATPKPDTGALIARLRTQHPDTSAADIAQRIGVTDRTVRRHLNANHTQDQAKEHTR
ncbi:helix-turn-helix domain-containing protein [Asanoa sp. NPDC050611]|uniref:helix-turn-helix domain-containing protein n=1 Tax=Asanoa sp. NPDC050611 TaxID=3157098 RepID=UPI0033C00406